jgi:iron complex outermembrane receptor protein
VGTLNPNINPFGSSDAAGVTALQAAQILQPTRVSKSTRDSIDGKISGELFKLPAGSVTFALGGEHRKEKFNDQPSAVLSSGDVIGGGGNQLPVDQSRKVSAVFGEMIVPITKELEALAQVRYDKYSDFGNTTNPKVGLRWQPVKQILVRGSYGTGFRAPTLPDLYTGVTQTNTGGSYNDPFYEAKVGNCYDSSGNPTVNFTPRYCNAQLTVAQGGNPNLKAEESKQHSLGLVFQPIPDFTVALDYWKIKIKQQIVQSDADQILSSFIGQFLSDPSAAYDPTTAKLSPAGVAALQGGATSSDLTIDAGTGFLDKILSPLANQSQTRVSGIDLSIKFPTARTGFGNFYAQLDSTYILSYKKNDVEFVGKYQGATSNNAGPVVRLRNSMSVDWTYGSFNTNLSYRWQSGYSDIGDTRRVGTYELFDLAFAYTGVKNLTLRAGIRNLFDRIPPYTRTADYFQIGYDPTYGDPRGRAFALGLNYQFR